MSSVAKDCVVLPQYDLSHGTFLLATPIVMSNYSWLALSRNLDATKKELFENHSVD